MLRHRIIAAACLIFSTVMATGNALFDNLPMTIMWGVILLLETLIFCFIVLSDAKGGLDE